jgi:serine/threonine-protein kinase
VSHDPGATLAGGGTAMEGETFVPKVPAPKTPGVSQIRSAKPISHTGVSSSSSDAIGGGRFAPGTVLEGRYRIVALAGRGGMGEVYRAEDLKLSQTVAIKFLPQSLSQDASALQRFHSEVRIARQVSHPNVCRMFDVGEVEGTTFLTMEFVDGEDLASLIRRIGRLPQDKAIEVARQICAGLAAAHDKGVIHRDLKPANIMLDGLGKVRINDFGLAGIAATIQGAEVRAGTPAYMAPEQLAGSEVTVKSDIYSLGLVLYEILTGKRAFEASTLQELIRLRNEVEITMPSSLVRDLDPLVERVILRCLDKDPAQRPTSVFQVAAALPGGDPLAAALAAGETPSPEMVAASGETEGLKPQIALAAFLGVVATLALMLFLVAKRTTIAGMIPFADSPEVLTARAREMIQKFGYKDAPADSASGFRLNSDYINYTTAHDNSPDRWRIFRDDEPPVMDFWYRQSPKLLSSAEPQDNLLWGRVALTSPPPSVSGMTMVVITLSGRLLAFEATPQQIDSTEVPAAPAASTNWEPLFTAAGLDLKKLKTVTPKWYPPSWGDSRVAWEGEWPGRSDVPLRVEAASFRGKPIYFHLIAPWTEADRMADSSGRRPSRIGQIFGLTLLGCIVAASIFVARKNTAQGRGDFVGARHLSMVLLLGGLINWALLAHHTASVLEYILFILAVGTSLFFSQFVRVLYVALEPFTRKHWPNSLVSWTRMLKGQFRDPVVGRDVLLGVLIGTCSALAKHMQYPLEMFLGRAVGRPAGFSLYTLEGIRGSLATVIFQLTNSLLNALFIFFVFFVLRLIFRKNWVAAVAIALLYCIPSLGASNPLIDSLFTAPFFLLFMFVLWRYGLVCLAALFFTDQLLNSLPIVTPLNAWYAEGGVIGLFVVLALAYYGFQVSRGGKPIFGGNLLER